jgi:hypothetical protein
LAQRIAHRNLSEVDVACDPSFTAAVQKSNQGGAFGGAGFTPYKDDNTRMRNIRRLI